MASAAAVRAMTETDAIQLRVVVFQDSGLWVAQCLEHDIGAQAPTVSLLCERLAIAVDVELAESMANGGVAFGDIAPAPDHFLRRWEESKKFGPERPVLQNANPQPIELQFGLCA